MTHLEHSSQAQITAKIAGSHRHLFLMELIRAARERDQENDRRLSELENCLKEKGESVLRGPVFECLEDIDWLSRGIRDPKVVSEAMKADGGPVTVLRPKVRFLSRIIKKLESTGESHRAIAALRADLQYIQETLALYTGPQSIFHNIGLRTLTEPIALDVFYKKGKKTLTERREHRIKLLLAVCMYRLTKCNFRRNDLIKNIIPKLVGIFYPQYNHLCQATRKKPNTGNLNSYLTSPVFETYKLIKRPSKTGRVNHFDKS